MTHKILKILFLVFVVISLPQSDVEAQFWTPCVDTVRQVNEYYPCFNEYEPVCGCNGVTYRNECSAYWQNAVNLYESGICGEIDIDIVPNYVSYENIKLSVYLKFQGSVNIAIYDVYGMMYYFDNISNFIGLQKREIPVQSLRHGVYFLVVFHNNEPITRKFVKAVQY